jgi:hypothetical protein
MADQADQAQRQLELAETKRKKEAYVLPEGKQGNCELCGEWSSRLVDEACVPCRNKWNLK